MAILGTEIPLGHEAIQVSSMFGVNFATLPLRASLEYSLKPQSLLGYKLEGLDRVYRT